MSFIDNVTSGQLLYEARQCCHNNNCTIIQPCAANSNVIASNYDSTKWINVFGNPLIIFVGLSGNSFSLVVLLGTSLRRQSTNIYLAFLCIVDIIFLLTLAANWLAWLGLSIFSKQGWCQVTVYLSYVSCFLSAWTIVSFTAERWLVVYFPLRKAVWCSRRRTIVILTCCAVFALLLYAFLLVIVDVIPAESGQDVCGTLPQYMGIMYVITLLDSVLTFTVPFSVITVLNACIACKVWLVTVHQRNGLFGSDDTDSCYTTLRRMRALSSKRHTLLTTDNLVNNADDDVENGNGAATAMQQLTKCNSNGTSNGGGAVSESGVSPTCDTVAVLLTTQLTTPLPSPCSMSNMQQLQQRKLLKDRVSVVSTGRKKSRVNRQMAYLKSLYEQQAEKRSRQIQAKATRTLLIISTAFLLFNMPSHVIRLYLFTLTGRGESSEEGDASSEVTLRHWQHSLQLLAYANFASNCFLYAALSRSFQTAARTLLLRLTQAAWAHCSGKTRR